MKNRSFRLYQCKAGRELSGFAEFNNEIVLHWTNEARLRSPGEYTKRYTGKKSQPGNREE